MIADPLPVGKLDRTMLSDLLAKYSRPDKRLLVGPKVGEDAAVLGPSPGCEVIATDPITFASDRIGWYVVHINANDIAVMGGRPRYLLLTLLLPQGRTSAADVEGIFAAVADACRELDITLAGGHTEITYGLERTIAVGQMIGEVGRDRIVTSSGARPGDTILLTKGIAIEGTAIIAREKREELIDSRGEGVVESAASLLDTPGISVVREALIACDTALPSAMHDPTEGGLATGLLELATASEVGLAIDEEAIPVLPECRAVCETFDLNPLGLIASGALLVTAPPEKANAIASAFDREGIVYARIGTIEERGHGLTISSADSTRPLDRFDVDEVARLFARGSGPQ
ncbi:MAG: hypothetical protein AMJ46_07545 [Latescibacteria bacterium DG_63]|uniref:Hydrogenase expression/formation protein n=1 Tax=candidate division TA06 bacterium SM23_40 TaxID=1703774 RepID=A0A0S8G7Q7_UNCT6|nr:MAG: hypothetical protein AMJ46_07545 [Latescibacteria bacterium DG_63]KPK69127.1 MAG: hypothetical protein AMJ82_06430 [candidate division TA06 bacterium SM23_40]